jgi:hypothetical protein
MTKYNIQYITNNTPTAADRNNVAFSLFKNIKVTIEYINPPIKIPNTFNVIFDFKKSCKVLGENCVEYVVNTTIIIENDIVTIDNRDPAIVERIVFVISKEVKNIFGK